jgi:hypothetical protein
VFSLVRRPLLVGTASVLLALCSSGASFSCAEAELVRLDPATGDREGSVVLGDPTTVGHVAIGQDTVWLAAACKLVEVDIDASEVVEEGDDRDACGPIVYGAGAAWRLSGRELVKHDPATGDEVRSRVPGRIDPELLAEGMDLAAGPQGVLVANPADCSVTRFGSGDLQATRRGRLPRCRGFWIRAMAVALGSSAVWVSVEHSRFLYRLDAGTLAIERHLRLRDRPRDIAATGDSLWVATDRGRLIRVDPASGQALRSIDLGGGSLSHVAAGGGGIWATNYDGDAVFRVDAGDLQVSEHEVHEPAGIAVSGREVWVSALAD